jgi:hypothetical protein
VKILRDHGFPQEERHGSLAHACAPTVTVPTVSVAVACMDRGHGAGLVVELPALRCGQFAQRFDGDDELAAGAALVPYRCLLVSKRECAPSGNLAFR